MSLILLPAIFRDDKTFVKRVLINTKDIMEPIIQNQLGACVLKVKESGSSSDRKSFNVVTYVVDISIEDITTGNEDYMFIADIVKKNDSPASINRAVFIKDRVIGAVVDLTPDPRSGIAATVDFSEFRYQNVTNASPDKYSVKQLLEDIKL